MLGGYLYHCKKPARAHAHESMTRHERAVRDLSSDALQALYSELRHNSTPWAKARRIAALDELERRSNLK